MVWRKQGRPKWLKQSDVASIREEAEERKMGQVMQCFVYQDKALAYMCVLHIWRTIRI